MEKLPSWWNYGGCFTSGHKHTSLLLWQEGVSTAFGFGSQGLTANWPLFWTGYTQLKWKHTELRAPCPETVGISQREKWAQTTAMCTDESWCRTRGGAGGFEHRKLWFHVKIPHPPRALTWSYSDAPGYRGQPRNSSAMTQPSDHMSMASQNGKPRMISGALVREKERKSQSQIFYSESCISSL